MPSRSGRLTSGSAPPRPRTAASPAAPAAVPACSPAPPTPSGPTADTWSPATTCAPAAANASRCARSTPSPSIRQSRPDEPHRAPDRDAVLPHPALHSGHHAPDTTRPRRGRAHRAHHRRPTVGRGTAARRDSTGCRGGGAPCRGTTGRRRDDGGGRHHRVPVDLRPRCGRERRSDPHRRGHPSRRRTRRRWRGLGDRQRPHRPRRTAAAMRRRYGPPGPGRRRRQRTALRRPSRHRRTAEGAPMIGLLIAGHGSADPAGAAQFRLFADRVAKRLAPQEIPVAGGFIELSPPPIRDAMGELVATGADRLAAVPLVLVAAGHAKGDIPAALTREQQRHPGLHVAYGRPLGPHPTILTVLRQRLSTADADPHTTVLLVGRGSTDPDANAEVAKIARLLAETTQVAGVEYAFVSLAPPDVTASLERCRRLDATRIVVLPYFLFTGVLPLRVADQARTWADAHPAVPMSCADVIGDCDELADVVIERYREALAGDIRMNCDTCLYRTPLPGHQHRVAAAQIPHHHPHDTATPSARH